MKASIIIPLWNGKEYIETCLQTVFAQNYPDLEVIVVDNASTDGGGELVQSTFPQVIYIRNLYNLGFAGACNVGLNVAQGEVMILLNQDTIGHDNWLNFLVDCMITDSKSGIGGCKLLYEDGTVQHAGGKLIEPFWDTEHLVENDGTVPIDYVTGATMAIRRDCFEQVGYLDENFYPAYSEDIDYCLRAKAVGWQIVYEPKAVLTHYESRSHTNVIDLVISNNIQRLRLVLKHRNTEWLQGDFFPAEKKRIIENTAPEWLLAMAHSYLAIVFSLKEIASWRQQFYHCDDTYSLRIKQELFLQLRRTATIQAKKTILGDETNGR